MFIGCRTLVRFDIMQECKETGDTIRVSCYIRIYMYNICICTHTHTRYKSLRITYGMPAKFVSHFHLIRCSLLLYMPTTCCSPIIVYFVFPFSPSCRLLGYIGQIFSLLNFYFLVNVR